MCMAHQLLIELYGASSQTLADGALAECLIQQDLTGNDTDGHPIRRPQPTAHLKLLQSPVSKSNVVPSTSSNNLLQVVERP